MPKGGKGVRRKLRKRIEERLRESTSAKSPVLNWVPEAVLHNAPISALVVAADIRSSTVLLKEAMDPADFARSVTVFIDHARAIVRRRGGVFDKFTGDGFLAYWLPDALNMYSEPIAKVAERVRRYDPRDIAYLCEQLLVPPKPPRSDNSTPPPDFESQDVVDARLKAYKSVLRACDAIIADFYETTMTRFRSQSSNLISRTGLSIGLDEGEVRIVPLAGQLTALGGAVVGATRMVDVARPWEVLANSYTGALLHSYQERVKPEIRVTESVRKTREYDDQVVYKVDFRSRAFPRPGKGFG